jgi:hypothetical protein
MLDLRLLCSYKPTYEDHQDELGEAVAAAIRERDKQQEIAESMKDFDFKRLKEPVQYSLLHLLTQYR